ncbi:MAG: hypothetical protein [Caudoviricetes sp.]|nr:MAG: hypothetical protein [Caudoviricetes sp.]
MELSDLTHDDLCSIAFKYLRNNGFGVAFHDKFKACTHSGEQPDAMGFRSGASCLIECKRTRSDFLADRKKKFRIDPDLGMGDWRFMLAPKGLIKVDELPKGWGLLETDGKRVYKTHGWPGNAQWISDRPFIGSKINETAYMYSALRRMEIRGHLKDVYEGVPT